MRFSQANGRRTNNNNDGKIFQIKDLCLVPAPDLGRDPGPSL
jgi:hypothetical protein